MHTTRHLLKFLLSFGAANRLCIHLNQDPVTGHLLHTATILHLFLTSYPVNAGRESRRAPASPVTPPPPEHRAAGVTNEDLAWELLYNGRFQLPAEEAEAAWADATGVTDVMREATPPVQGMSAEQVAEQTAKRVRRIAEAAFWDSLTGELLHNLHCHQHGQA